MTITRHYLTPQLSRSLKCPSSERKRRIKRMTRSKMEKKKNSKRKNLFKKERKKKSNKRKAR
jgi:hypothetical protein